MTLYGVTKIVCQAQFTSCYVQGSWPPRKRGVLVALGQWGTRAVRFSHPQVENNIGDCMVKQSNLFDKRNEKQRGRRAEKTLCQLFYFFALPSGPLKIFPLVAIWS